MIEKLDQSVAGPLSESQLRLFQTQGFLIPETLRISEQDVAWCRDILLTLLRKGVGRHEGRNFDISEREGNTSDGVTQQLFRPSLYSRPLRKFAFRHVGLAIARQILGPEAFLAADNVVYKPPGGGGVTPWHQDEAYNDPNSYQRQATIWIALYDTNLRNGAMAFVPGSHQLGILEHRLQDGAAKANSIECCGIFPVDSAVVCPLRAGQMTIHHGRTIHGASANAGDTPRLGYILNYKTPPESRSELGRFPWNEKVASSVNARRRAWLRRGGIFVEFARFLLADPVDRSHFFSRITSRFVGKRRS